MRVSQNQLDIIVKTIKGSIEDAAVFLFGSRVDDEKKGGDIDLFLLTDHSVRLTEKISILTQLEKKGIERKVDLIISTPENRYDKLYSEVLNTGIRLC
ncbi:MAG: nucleotidyltransferase domain-containing protein [Spirochaetales bacterium]|nr:nucleotidyltransferase domain-containing protein [Spirochaetales bacterium]